jgi:transcriptional regulator with XRE-family HTH domain
MNYDDFIRNRITQLRINKNVSEYQMSLDLGHSKSYIQSITSGRALPSMTEFLSICDYLEITPKDFFDDGIENPDLIQKAVDGLKQLNETDTNLILSNINRLLK